MAFLNCAVPVNMRKFVETIPMPFDMEELYLIVTYLGHSMQTRQNIS